MTKDEVLAKIEQKFERFEMPKGAKRIGVSADAMSKDMAEDVRDCRGLTEGTFITVNTLSPCQAASEVGLNDDEAALVENEYHEYLVPAGMKVEEYVNRYLVLIPKQ